MTIKIGPPVVLESGDRLSREEFHQRYCARPDIQKAELVKGVVYVASPLRTSAHGEPHAAIIGWLYVYVSTTQGVKVTDNATVYLDADTEVQPDACLYRDPPLGAGARRNQDDYLVGPPELVVEIAASSATYDLHDKLDAYRRAGVPEYLVWQVLDHQFTWFRLRNGVYQTLAPDAAGVIESEVFPGLRLSVPALLAGDHAGVIAALHTP